MREWGENNLNLRYVNVDTLRMHAGTYIQGSALLPAVAGPHALGRGEGGFKSIGRFCVFGHEYFEVMESRTKQIVGKMTEDPNGKCRDGSSSNSTTSIQQLKP